MRRLCHTHAPEQAAAASGLEYAYAEVYILAEAHAGEAAEAGVDIAADAHVERAGIEFVELFPSAAYAAGGEEARHGVGDGLLGVGERWVGAVGTAEGVGRLAFQFVVNGLQIALWQYDVRVEHDEPFAFRPFGAVVAALSGSGIGLCVIADVQPPVISVCHVAAVDRRAILNDDDLEVAQRLACEAVEQFVHLVGTVEYGDDE